MQTFDALRAWLNEQATNKVYGASAAVSVRGERIFTGFAGFSDADGRCHVGADTVFRLASMTKPITAAAIMLCLQRGLLRLDDDVSDYIPAFREMYVAEKTQNGWARGRRAGPLTLRRLLTHTSGLGSGAYGDSVYGSIKPHPGDTLQTAVGRYAGCLLDFMPGMAQHYSAVLAFDVLAAVVERVTGTKYGTFVKEEIFLPLGMEHTGYRLSEFPPSELAVTCACKDGVLTPEPLNSAFEDFPDGYTGGGAGLLSSLGDYMLFAEELLRALAGKGRILSRESVAEMSRPQLGKNIEGISDYYNWGFGVRALAAQCEWQPLPAGSFGWSGAYGTHFWVDPAGGTVAVYMHNSRTFGGAGAPHTLEFERLVTDSLGRGFTRAEKSGSFAIGEDLVP